MKNSMFSTVGGFIAILLWSTTIAITRSISEHLGPITAAASVYTVSGIISLISIALNRQKRKDILKLSTKYLIGCGLLFVIYMTMLFLAIGWAINRQQVMEVGLINYLWPPLTLIFSIIILNKKSNWLIFPGTLFSLIGIYLVLSHGRDISWNSFTQNIGSNPIVYLLALTASISWALYSTLTNKWAGGKKTGAVVLFLPSTAVVLLFFSFLVKESRDWSIKCIEEVLFLGIATYLAYSLWDASMRRGNVSFVAAGSYLTPLFSTIVSYFYLSVIPGATLWTGCIILITGSVLSWRSISNTQYKSL